MNIDDSSDEFFISEVESRIKTLVELVDGLKRVLLGKKISAVLIDRIEQFDNLIKDFFKRCKEGADVRAIIDLVPFINIQISSIFSDFRLEDFGFDSSSARNSVTEAVADLNKIINDRSVVFSPSLFAEDFHWEEDDSINSRKLKPSDKIDMDFKKSLNTALEKTNSLKDKVDNLEYSVQQNLLKVQELYDSTLVNLKEKKSEIDDLVGLVSGNVVAGSYENSAATEKKVADILRTGSLLCMLVVIAFVGYSFYETTTKGFNWEASLFRLVFSIFLSIPAAYLARESTKHRMQQYSHLQISLDLKAVNPYIASLPEADQHRLKTEIAGRLFAGKDNEKIGSDSYPINTHELLMALIGKMEFKNKNSEK